MKRFDAPAHPRSSGCGHRSDAGGANCYGYTLCLRRLDLRIR